MAKKKTQDEILREFYEVWKGRYTYPRFVYINAKTISFATCPIHGDFPTTADNHKHGCGCPKCARILPQYGNRDKVFGIGVLDIPFSKNLSEETRRAYSVWQDILDRCYNVKRRKRLPTYSGCTVCDEWVYFSNFLKWYNENVKHGQHIDKDIIVKGNKVYSPSTCCSVPKAINSMIASCHSRGKKDLPVGVYRCGNKYVSYMYDKDSNQKYLGVFDSIENAFNIYKKEKEKYIQKVAREYYENGEITRRVYDALMRYEVEITD